MRVFKILQSVTFITLLLMHFSCAEEGSFAGGVDSNRTQIADNDAVPEELPTIDAISSEEDPSTIELPMEEQQLVLAECIDQWDDHPFTEIEIASPKIYETSEDKANGDIVFSDRKTSTKPNLVLVKVSLNVANKGVVELDNSNGWYCLYFAGRIANNFTIYKKTQNKMATVSKTSQTSNNFRVVER